MHHVLRFRRHVLIGFEPFLTPFCRIALCKLITSLTSPFAGHLRRSLAINCFILEWCFSAWASQEEELLLTPWQMGTMNTKKTTQSEDWSRPPWWCTPLESRGFDRRRYSTRGCGKGRHSCEKMTSCECWPAGCYCWRSWSVIALAGGSGARQCSCAGRGPDAADECMDFRRLSDDRAWTEAVKRSNRPA